MTMTPEELLIVLYDELIKRLRRAEISLDGKKYELFEESVDRSVEIVKYFKECLNFEYELSYELARMYDFFIFELSRLKSGRKATVVEEILPLVIELREAFEVAGKSA